MLNKNGIEQYSLELSLASMENAYLQYKQSNSEDIVVFTGGST
jgi:hypothetical protein